MKTFNEEIAAMVEVALLKDALQRISMLHYNNDAELLDAVTIAQAAITQPTEE